jgi:di/tricarboxylate transporter
MKKLEWLALVLVVLILLTTFLSLFGDCLFARLYGREFVGKSNAQLRAITTVRSVLSIIVHLAVGIWLFVQARQSKGTPWIWLLFGLVYGLLAAVLFFLLKMCEQKNSSVASAGNAA